MRKKERSRIEKLIPGSLKGSCLWSDNMLMNYSISDEDEIIMHYLKRNKTGLKNEPDNKIMMELFTDFANDIEQWAVNMHKISPVYFFIGNSRVNGSKWDKYSNSMIGEILNYIENNLRVSFPREKQIFYEALCQIKSGKSYLIPKDQLKQAEILIKKLS